MRLTKLSVIAATGAAGVLTAFGTVAASATDTGADRPAVRQEVRGDGVSAAGTCGRASPLSRWFRCHNRPGATVYSRGTPRPIDHLRTNPSLFRCRKEGRPTGGGGPHPRRWVWTQGDDHKRFGWVKDSDIADETNPISVCWF